MSFLVFSGSTPLIKHHPEYTSWVNDTQDVVECHGVDDIPGKSTSLFFDPPAIILNVESIKASDLRQLLYRAEETGENMCIIASQKPRGNFEKDGIEIIDVSYPKPPRQRSSVLQDMFDITDKQSLRIAKTYDDPSVACVIARQCEFIDSNESWSQFFIPEEKGSPPWLITDAINSGDAATAMRETSTLLKKKKSSPQSLAMQITGYYTKAVTSSGSFFSKLNRRNIKDKAGMVDDMAHYPEVIMQAGKTSAQHSLKAYVASLASRCKN